MVGKTKNKKSFLLISFVFMSGIISFYSYLINPLIYIIRKQLFVF